jgi:transcriptional regulator with XRE-family HTH domain
LGPGDREFESRPPDHLRSNSNLAPDAWNMPSWETWKWPTRYKARILRGWTHRDLGRKARVDEATLCDLFAGRRIPTFGALRALCIALGLSFESVISFEGPQKRRRRPSGVCVSSCPQRVTGFLSRSPSARTAGWLRCDRVLHYGGVVADRPGTCLRISSCAASIDDEWLAISVGRALRPRGLSAEPPAQTQIRSRSWDQRFRTKEVCSG